MQFCKFRLNIEYFPLSIVTGMHEYNNKWKTGQLTNKKAKGERNCFKLINHKT